MVVGCGTIRFRLHGCRSLKEKRHIIKSILSRVQNNFNISIAETGSLDIYQRAEIGFAFVGNETAFVNSKVDKVFNFIEALGLADIVDTEIEMIHL